MARVQFTLEAAGMKEVLASFDQIPQQTEQAIKPIVNRTAMRITRKAKQRVRKDQGRLGSSIAMRPYHGGLEVEVGTNVPYAPYIEFGTAKGVDITPGYEQFAAQFKGSGKWPPPGALLEWMKRHGIPAEAEFLIRRKIGTEGIKAQPFLYNSFEEEKGPYLDELKKVLGGLS